MRPDDWAAVRRIYREGMDTRNATFETELPDWERFDRDHLAAARLVAEEDGRVVGWAALAPVSRRAAYRGLADVSVYVAADARGRGHGRRLLEGLVEASERAGIWTLQAGIFPENEASLALHAACGFRRLGVRERPGALDGVWRDVVLLERRSRVVGAG
jgi:phosphinothricin acetyltransferase